MRLLVIFGAYFSWGVVGGKQLSVIHTKTKSFTKMFETFQTVSASKGEKGFCKSKNFANLRI